MSFAYCFLLSFYANTYIFISSVLRNTYKKSAPEVLKIRFFRKTFYTYQIQFFNAVKSSFRYFLILFFSFLFYTVKIPVKHLQFLVSPIV